MISKITVNPKDNGFTISMDICLENLHDFIRLFWMAVPKVIAKDKNTFSGSIKVTIIASIVVILMSFLGNDLTNQK